MLHVTPGSFEPASNLCGSRVSLFFFFASDTVAQTHRVPFLALIEIHTFINAQILFQSNRVP